jgi:DNA mismatch endonuclease (patch repair protein)
VADRLASATRRRLMQAIKGKNTKPELVVRSLLHKLGYRFRLRRKDLPGTPDIVFPSRKAAIFVHGCFWHGHLCRIGQLPKSRIDYWKPKISANRTRDDRKQAALAASGWRLFVVWQCELTDTKALAGKLGMFLEA